MVVIMQQQQQQETTSVSAEEEALKRNTDCVYFLASPLTCKKGSECEYRHSEYARLNPRDCYYWLNGNCLNPRCGFRHPPLDGLLGTQGETSAGPSLPQSHKTAAPVVPTPQNSGKQAVRCIFFQKGFCLRGDKCAFLHGPSPASNKISQPPAPSTGTELPSESKAFGGPQKFTRDQKIPQPNLSKVTEAKPAIKPEISSQRHGTGVERNLPPSKRMDAAVPKSRATSLHPVVNGDSSRFSHLHHLQVSEDQSLQNGRDIDDLVRETSPGFDVLVDSEELYGGATGHEGRVDEYDVGNSADYSSVVNFNRETFDVLRGYDISEHMRERYAWDQHQSSPERMPQGPAHLEKRGYLKADSSDHVDNVDLRHRLSKHRRTNELRSVISHDFVSDNHAEDGGYHRLSRRDQHNSSNHLHGRIKLPGRSSNGSDLHLERDVDKGFLDVDKGRAWGRLSPRMSQIPSHQGRIRDRIKPRVEEDNSSEGRILESNRMRRKSTDDGSANFAGPKSLAELKGIKGNEGMAQQSLGKRKQMENHQASEHDLSFEGPMPLSEILKRKREAGAAASGSASSFNKPDNNQKESKESSSNNAARDENNRQMPKDGIELQSATAVENTETDLRWSSQSNKSSEAETVNGTIVDDVEEDQENDAGDQGEGGEYEYEQGDEEEYYEEGENAGDKEEYYEEGENAGGEEYVDDEEGDGDDFAKKIGVMFS